MAITHDMRLVAERADRAIAVSEGRIIFDEACRDDLFSDGIVLQTARLRAPPLTVAGQRLGLVQPLLRVGDVVDILRPDAAYERAAAS